MPALMVVLVKDNVDEKDPTYPCWFAQGVQIDYAAQGNSLEKCKRNFLIGLEDTIELQIEKFGKPNLKSAPISMLVNALSDIRAPENISEIVPIESKLILDNLPFDSVEFCR